MSHVVISTLLGVHDMATQIRASRSGQVQIPDVVRVTSRWSVGKPLCCDTASVSHRKRCARASLLRQVDGSAPDAVVGSSYEPAFWADAKDSNCIWSSRAVVNRTACGEVRGQPHKTRALVFPRRKAAGASSQTTTRLKGCDLLVNT